jgi:adenosyl cobinamide kinase/adenosyl cobinamide phosphate guanylyltransferase
VITLVLGGARSGKSKVAEAIVKRSVGDGASRDPVTYVATGVANVGPAESAGTDSREHDGVGGARGDADFAARIAAHRARRPPDWLTVEVALAGDLASALAACPGPAIVDSIGTWVAGHRDFAVKLEPLLATLGKRKRATVLVSDEVGWGVHPATEAGRAFRDALGAVNLTLAEVADEALLVVAGRVIELPRYGPSPGGRE